MKDEMETVDVESCSDDVPDSGSDISNVGKVAGVLYKSVCLLNKDSGDDPISSWDPNSHMGGRNNWPFSQANCFQKALYYGS